MEKKYLKSPSGYTLFDRYSMRHFIFGTLCGIVLMLLGLKYEYLQNFKDFILIGLIILFIWEMFEAIMRFIKFNLKKYFKFLHKFIPDNVFEKESKINIVGDIVAGFAGLIIIYLIF